MSLSLVLVMTSAPPAPDVLLENLLFIGVCLILFIFTLIVCDALMRGASKAFEASADWLEHKSAKRRKRRAALRKYYPPLRVVHSQSEPINASLLAHDALRRSAEAAHRTDQTPVRPKSNLRAVTPGERA
ncbi:MAG: hypothetical protein WCD76_05400 [Pyrinomonadaceae bacterium]